MSDTNTPRTDKARREAREIEDLFPLADECAKLEVELAVANERIRQLTAAGDELWKISGSFVVREVDDLHGDHTIPVDSIGEDYEITPECPPTAGEHVRLDRALEQWTKAKEAKP